MRRWSVLKVLSVGVILASLGGCYSLGTPYPGFGYGRSYGYGYGYPGSGYGYPYGSRFYGGYGLGYYYPYGYGGGRRYRNTQLWSAHQWLRNNPGTALSPGQTRWLRHHR